MGCLDVGRVEENNDALLWKKRYLIIPDVAGTISPQPVSFRLLQMLRDNPRLP